ncbi:MAG: SDR family oxidoreductase [Planctomycetes bacterium]|nr:SDR family oxidoreductase [Planctomycetota bacterium]
MIPDARPIVVTGATGYVGGRLVPELVRAGFRVRCIAREPRKLDERPWRRDPGIEVVAADLRDTGTLTRALTGVRAAYYLVHSMMSSDAAWRQQDRELAISFARAAAAAHVERIIYLGGLGELGDSLSEHLASRREVERWLASTGIPVTTLRAAMIIGSGSASFEILRYLVEHLPVMLTPRWVRTESQPIAIRNVLGYLVGCLRLESTAGQTLDIGGPEIVSYRELMRIMAQARGLGRRLVIPVPVLTPRLSSLWIHLVTPVPHTIARPLAEGLRNRTVCRDDRAAKLMPQRLLTMREAIDAALGKSREHAVETAWSDAGAIPGDPDWAGGTVYEDRREIVIDAPREIAWRTVQRIGGDSGWYGGQALWRLRGLLDKVVGGPGLRRGRRDPDRVMVGDALDFWRVVDVVPDRSLVLQAEMRLPGVALLRLDLADGSPTGGAERDTSGHDLAATRLTLTARFKPRGLFGILYWYAVLPLHSLVFPAMLKGLRRDAERAAYGPPSRGQSGQSTGRDEVSAPEPRVAGVSPGEDSRSHE